MMAPEPQSGALSDTTSQSGKSTKSEKPTKGPKKDRGGTKKPGPEKKSGPEVKVDVKAEAVPMKVDINHKYFIETHVGILKLVQLGLGILCMGLGSPVIIGYAHFFMFVVVVSFIATLAFSLVHLLSLTRLFPKYTAFQWIQAEFYTNVGQAGAIFMASVVMLAMTSRADIAFALGRHGYHGQYIAAGVFALFNFVAYCGSSFYYFVEFKAARKASVTTTSTNP